MRKGRITIIICVLFVAGITLLAMFISGSSKRQAGSEALSEYRTAVSYLQQAKGYINATNSPPDRVALVLEKGAGYLTAVAGNLQQSGIPHLYGIAAKLDEVAVELANPATSEQLRTSDRQFIEEAYALLNKAIVNNSLNKQLAQDAVGKVYSLMTPYERESLWDR